METRQKTEYCFYVIVLNPMKGRAEDINGVAAFTSKEEALAFYLSCVTEPWVDEEQTPDFFGNAHSYNKAFKRGSLLEWYNPPFQTDMIERMHDAMGCGIVEHWTENGSVAPEDWTIPLNPQPYVAL